jgi:hypothetical protein
MTRGFSSVSFVSTGFAGAGFFAGAGAGVSTACVVVSSILFSTSVGVLVATAEGFAAVVVLGLRLVTMEFLP